MECNTSWWVGWAPGLTERPAVPTTWICARRGIPTTSNGSPPPYASSTPASEESPTTSSSRQSPGRRGIEFGTWTTAAGDLDTLHDIPNTDRQHPNTYDELIQRATTREFLGCTIYVADLGDIIASKKATARDKDREALPELEALRAAQLARTACPEGIEAALGERDVSSTPTTQQPGSGQDYGRDPPGRTRASVTA